MRRIFVIAAVCVAMMGCEAPVASQRTVTVTQALSSPSEVLEQDSRESRHELFKEVARISQDEFSKPVEGPVLFPLVRAGNVAAAPGLTWKQDLLWGSDAGSKYQLSFDGEELWSEERRESLLGLSEREAIEPVARALLSHWGIDSLEKIRVERAPGTPYAAAYVDGTLRVNPSFVYMAVASAGATLP